MYHSLLLFFVALLRLIAKAIRVALSCAKERGQNRKKADKNKHEIKSDKFGRAITILKQDVYPK